MSVVTTILPIRPVDATLSVTKAARLLGVHPNTIRSWSDQGRLRYYRINPRGDRRYRLGDLQRFLESAAGGAVDDVQAASGSLAAAPAGTPRHNATISDFPAAARRRPVNRPSAAGGPPGAGPLAGQRAPPNPRR